MNKKKALNMLGLAMRAGKLITGEELTINEIRKHKVSLVIVTTDASENTQKKLVLSSGMFCRIYSRRDFRRDWQTEKSNRGFRPRIRQQNYDVNNRLGR